VCYVYVGVTILKHISGVVSGF